MVCFSHRLAAFAVLCCLVGVTGCAASLERAGGAIGRLAGKKTPEQILDIKTPEDRAQELRELAKSAASKPAAEQEAIVGQLAKEIQFADDPLMRRRILRVLAEIRTPVSFALLRAGLQDSDLEVRRVACEALAKHGGPEAVAQLQQVASGDTDIDVRIAAVRALGETKEKAAVQPLVEALVDRDPAVQYRAQQALRAVSGRDYGGNVEAWREYAATGNSTAKEVSLAERLRRGFF